MIEARVEAIRTACDADTVGEVSRNILTLAARWSPARAGAVLGDALELAGLAGREEVFQEVEAAEDFAVSISNTPFKEQIAFLRQKRPVPTRRWTDAMYGDHDRAFVVAGVTDLAMLEEFHAAVISAAETYDRRAFAQDFDRLVEKYGWKYNGQRDWRIRTIFETNIRTSYMAGRLAQMRDPDVISSRPYWQYRHGETRIPLSPRPQHVVWNGVVLMHDDIWWQKHFPPNDWRCSCGVKTLSQRDLDRMGKTGPDRAPNTLGGIGKGWDYMPGDLWERGLVPSALINEAGGPSERPRHLAWIDEPSPIEELRALAKPFLSKVMEPDFDMQEYIDAFLTPFGATKDLAVLWEDVAGEKLVISQEIFRTRDGAFKVGKRGREIYAPLMAETIMDPDEIWIGLIEKKGADMPIFDRRYIRTDGETGIVGVFEVGRKEWNATTIYPTGRGDKSSLSTLEARRGGKLIWKRKGGLG